MIVRRTSVSLASLVVLLGVAGAFGARGDEPAASAVDRAPPRYLSSSEVAARLDRLQRRAAARGLAAEVRRYGTSAGGRPLVCLALGRGPSTVFVHGGLGRRDAAGPVAVLALAERLVERPAEHDVAFLLVPAPNPDALDGFFLGAYPPGGGDVDRDRDGRRGEDGPRDLDQDGEIVKMRRLSVAGAFADAAAPPGLAAERRDVVPAGTDARRARSYDLFDEGRDDDGDGRVNEDPPGLDLTRGIEGWFEGQGPWDGDGPFPGSAPEARALMDLTWNEAGLVLFVGLESAGPRVLYGPEAGPLPGGDRGFEERVGRALAEAVRRPLAPASGLPQKSPGSDLDWAVCHLGLAAARLPLWWVEKDPGRTEPREVADDVDWALWDERVLSGRGFVPWHAFRHPTLGAVEIGGWRRFTRYEPPRDRLADLVPPVVEALAALARFVPRLEPLVEVESVGAGLYSVTVRVANRGEAPTDTEQAEARRVHHPVRVLLEPASGVLVVAGGPAARVGRIEAGAVSSSARWLLEGHADGPLARVRVIHPRAREARAEVLAP